MVSETNNELTRIGKLKNDGLYEKVKKYNQSLSIIFAIDKNVEIEKQSDAFQYLEEVLHEKIELSEMIFVLQEEQKNRLNAFLQKYSKFYDNISIKLMLTNKLSKFNTKIVDGISSSFGDKVLFMNENISNNLFSIEENNIDNLMIQSKSHDVVWLELFNVDKKLSNDVVGVINSAYEEDIIPESYVGVMLNRTAVNNLENFEKMPINVFFTSALMRLSSSSIILRAEKDDVEKAQVLNKNLYNVEALDEISIYTNLIEKIVKNSWIFSALLFFAGLFFDNSKTLMFSLFVVFSSLLLVSLSNYREQKHALASINGKSLSGKLTFKLVRKGEKLK